MDRKLAELQKHPDGPILFDPAGYKAYLDESETELNEKAAAQSRKQGIQKPEPQHTERRFRLRRAPRVYFPYVYRPRYRRRRQGHVDHLRRDVQADRGGELSGRTGAARGAHFQDRFRGAHVLQRDENGLEKCVACFLCAAACPRTAFISRRPRTPRRSGSRRGALCQGL